MKYLLDTNICVFFFKGQFNIVNAFKAKGYENCCVSEITVAELRYGAENSTNPHKHHELLDCFLKKIAIIPISDSISLYAKEKVRLKKAGTPVHDDFDLLIGATAIQNKLTLVTDNVKDFERLAAIKIENWVKR
ncbi:MAG: type II toxin-antitoxin system VapC family toxin [Prevotellaceae bacterium]|jgi:tRNA(fMet)-specific endonuclease VapC|nr:type II toxin-antitoxin system VapC family toxin [Prevotellaceae bacterium]